MWKQGSGLVGRAAGREAGGHAICQAVGGGAGCLRLGNILLTVQSPPL